MDDLIRYVQSPAVDDHASGVRVFLAGSARDRDWRRRFAELLSPRGAPFVLYDPLNFDWHENAVDRRIDWEVRHFERADLVAAWLPAGDTDDLSALSPTTCFELGQLATIKPELHVGIAPPHPARALLGERLQRYGIGVVDSLEALAARLPERGPQVNLLEPKPLPGERHFHFGAEVRFEDLFELGVAVRTQRVRVTFDAQCPMARELTAQLNRLQPS